MRGRSQAGVRMQADLKVDVPASLASQRLVRLRERSDVMVDLYYPLRMAVQIAIAAAFLWQAFHHEAPFWSKILIGSLLLFAVFFFASFVGAVARSNRFWVVHLGSGQSPPELLLRCTEAMEALGWQIQVSERDFTVATPTRAASEPARVVTVVANEDRMLFNSRRVPERGRRAFCRPEEVRKDLLTLLSKLGSHTILSGPHGAGTG